MSSVQWLSWSADAFARARVEAKPVLLSISAPWCHWCHEMDRTSYADPAVVACINEGFVPIRVDADRRPDIAERYSLGGYPTTAFLTADGEVVGGGTYMPPERLAGVLTEVARAFATRGDDIAARAQAADVAHDPERTQPLSEAALVTLVFGSFDAEHGGFGTEPKFPLVPPIRLALDLYRERQDPGFSHVATMTLDAMGWGALYDDVEGGFFRYATTRAWQLPHFEKLLDVNASLAALYLEAAGVLGGDRYRDRAADVFHYVQSHLADVTDGGWWGSQAADSDYYASSTVAARERLPAPPIDRVLYSGWNGLMTSAALAGAASLGDPALGEFAIRSLERVLTLCYRPGAGVAHAFDGRPDTRGLLEDQLALATACLDAWEASGNIVYEMMAEELVHYALRVMWDDTGAGLFDRAPAEPLDDVGRMRQRIKPFAANCEAATLLVRLAKASGDDGFADRAAQVLAWLAPRAATQGVGAASYVLAMRSARLR